MKTFYYVLIFLVSVLISSVIKVLLNNNSHFIDITTFVLCLGLYELLKTKKRNVANEEPLNEETEIMYENKQEINGITKVIHNEEIEDMMKEATEENMQTDDNSITKRKSFFFTGTIIFICIGVFVGLANFVNNPKFDDKVISKIVQSTPITYNLIAATVDLDSENNSKVVTNMASEISKLPNLDKEKLKGIANVYIGYNYHSTLDLLDYLKEESQTNDELHRFKFSHQTNSLRDQLLKVGLNVESEEQTGITAKQLGVLIKNSSTLQKSQALYKMAKEIKASVSQEKLNYTLFYHEQYTGDANQADVLPNSY